VNQNRIGKSYGSAARKLASGLLIALATLAVSGLASAQTYRQPTLAKFRGGIAVDPVANISAAGVVTLNIVRGVSPAGTWRISDLDATVRADGHITVVGRGLLLANGNGIGTNANQSVHASLFCGPAATATEHDTTLTGVPLESDGDFVINDSLSPAPPATCTTPVLLIRNVGGVWFAAGIASTK
jgi:hypothetical protein